jgi:hypothetical protein
MVINHLAYASSFEIPNDHPPVIISTNNKILSYAKAEHACFMDSLENTFHNSFRKVPLMDSPVHGACEQNVPTRAVQQVWKSVQL